MAETSLDPHGIDGVAEPPDFEATYRAKARAEGREPNTLLLRIFEHIGGQDFHAIAACELAPGVIAVADSLWETDVYFDLREWRFTGLSLWDPHGNASYVVAEGLGVLEGVGGGVYSIGASRSFALRNLSSTGAVEWHEEPQPL